MGNIVLLDELTINKIAAGEVIERPTNVVKELVENSIDAGATSIVIEIKKGGKTFIKISDNGKGISKEDIPNSLERHATSKIRNVEDLENTYTMGFRGEALASISAVSKLTMTTKTASDSTGIKIEAEAGEIINGEEISAVVGTTIIVEELFFNTPVRYKFLKQDQTEFKYIKDWVQKTAMANPNISFKLFNDNKIVFKTNGNGNIKDIIYMMYSKETVEHLIDVDYSENEMKITGVIGDTFIATDTRKNQIVFLNKRNIKNQTISGSADQAFKGATGIGKYGFFILNLEMPATYYDVNVHPTKTEVRFKNEDDLYKFVYRAIKTTMLKKEYLGNTEETSKKSEYVEDEFQFVTNHFQKSNKRRNFGNLGITSSGIDLIKRDEKRNINYKYIGIAFKTFIIIEIENESYLIDQHAAHERVLYEQIKANYKEHLKNNSQMMLFPEIVTLSNKEIEFVKNNINLFQMSGFDIEFFGNNALKINGVPDIEYREKINNRDMFMDILDEMISNTRSPIKDIEERFIATVACKAAVKANMVLTEPEVHSLIQSLLSLKNPYTCPHGRPTAIKFWRKGDFFT